MGLASSIGLGLALAKPKRKVMVLDGDGSVLMNLGTLAAIALHGRKTFAAGDPGQLLLRLHRLAAHLHLLLPTLPTSRGQGSERWRRSMTSRV